MFRPRLVTSLSLLVLAGASPAIAGQATTTRIEPRAFYGATVTLEEGVRVYRALPVTRHVIINPGNKASVSVNYNEERTYNYGRGDSSDNGNGNGNGGGSGGNGGGSASFSGGDIGTPAGHARGDGRGDFMPRRGGSFHGKPGSKGSGKF